MGLLRGPLRLRIEGGAVGTELAARAARDGIVLAGPDEEADLVASPVPRGPLAGLAGGSVPLEPKPRPGPPPLPPRELQILEYLADGWSNAEIASVLGISTRTVRFHLESLYLNLGVRRRGEAVREAVRLGFIRFEA